MSPYRAQLGGVFGSGMHFSPTQPLDVGGIIDAVAGGASGLIHQAYSRRMAQHQMAREDAQLELERQREERQAEHERRMAMASGVVPGSTTVERVPTAASPAPEMASGATIRGAFAHGLDAPPATPVQTSAPEAAGAPAPDAPARGLTTPVTEGSLGEVPHLQVRTTPDRYDPAYDRVRVRTLDAIGARGAEARQTEDARQQGRVDRDAARHTYKLEELADKAARDASRSKAHDDRVTARGPAGSGGARGALTANGKEVAKRTLLDGLVSYHGDEQKVRDYLTSDEIGKGSAEKYGVTDADITAAVGRARRHEVDQTVHDMGAGRKPEKAAARIRGARDAVTRGAAGAASGASGGTPSTSPASGAPSGGAGSGGSMPALTDAQKQRAAADPEYKAFKLSQGYKF
jgi:hypothetical protein